MAIHETELSRDEIGVALAAAALSKLGLNGHFNVALSYQMLGQQVLSVKCVVRPLDPGEKIMANTSYRVEAPGPEPRVAKEPRIPPCPVGEDDVPVRNCAGEHS